MICLSLFKRWIRLFNNLIDTDLYKTYPIFTSYIFLQLLKKPKKILTKICVL